MDVKNDSNLHSVGRRPRRSPLLLLIVPFVGTLWVSTYATTTPEIWGIPFFYWYQFLWIAISAVITIAVYLVERSPSAPRTAVHDESQ